MREPGRGPLELAEREGAIMTDTHTLGPWYVKQQEDLDPHGNGYVWAIKGKRTSEEKGITGGWKDYVQNPAYANNEANARLIAAAPDLLVACEVANRFFEENDDFTDGGYPIPGFILDMRIAIKKATGRCREEVSA
jgi:hypothetical protein